MQSYQLHEKPILLRSSQFCARTSNLTDICRGDIGGSVIVSVDGSGTNDKKYWYLAGILSIQPKQCGQSPDVFTRVTSFKNWILENIVP